MVSYAAKFAGLPWLVQVGDLARIPVDPMLDSVLAPEKRLLAWGKYPQPDRSPSVYSFRYTFVTLIIVVEGCLRYQKLNSSTLITGL
jgi:hypothetical protein